MSKGKSEVASAIARAREELDRTLSRLETLAEDDRERVSYSIHALNNYLMVVSTTLQLLRKKLGPKGDADVRRWLDSLKQATNLMMSTARGVLTASSAEIPPLLLAPACLTEIAEGVCRAYGDVARRKQVRIGWKASRRRDHVLTDRVAVGAILDNLLSNAVKYSSRGTVIVVTTSIEERNVLCSVRDRGPGLSETDQAQLFQRGVRLTAQPTAGETSNGYGLAIASDLARALGGRLSCASVLGDGACFTLSLPLATEASGLALPSDASALSRAPLLH